MERKEKSKIFGNNILKILKEKEMIAQELADITGLDTRHLSLIINGKRLCISLPIANKIAMALNSKIEDVFILKPIE